jgi:hypothetical protein
MKRKMIRFALGVWCGCFPDITLPAAKACCWAREEAASQPKPHPDVWRKERREGNMGASTREAEELFLVPVECEALITLGSSSSITFSSLSTPDKASLMKYNLILLIILGLLTPAMAAEKTAKPSGRAQVAAKTLTPAERTRLLSILNEGDDQALQSLPGIGATRAVAIKKARPLTDPVALVKVEGIGDSTLVDIVAHAKAGFPEAKKEEAEVPQAPARKPAPAKSGSASKRPE